MKRALTWEDWQKYLLQETIQVDAQFQLSQRLFWAEVLNQPGASEWYDYTQHLCVGSLRYQFWLMPYQVPWWEKLINWITGRPSKSHNLFVLAPPGQGHCVELTLERKSPGQYNVQAQPKDIPTETPD